MTWINVISQVLVKILSVDIRKNIGTILGNSHEKKVRTVDDQCFGTLSGALC